MRMPRSQRKPSNCDVYHVMARGINQLQLFYDDEDRRCFLERLEKLKEGSAFELYAWCLMGNHVHLLLRAPLKELSALMKRLLLSYSHAYNAKYDRTGYLYQDRFKSEPVEDEAYFLAVLRYIHRNPIKVGKSLSDWTSFDEYLGSARITDTEKALEMLGATQREAKAAFKRLVEQEDDPDGTQRYAARPRRASDKEAIELIKEVAGVNACSDVAALSADALANVIPQLRGQGLSIRQIARLTGLNRGVVEKLRP